LANAPGRRLAHLKTFGITSAVGGLVGALLHGFLRSPVLTRLFAIRLIFAGVAGLTDLAKRMRFAGWVAGALSGCSAGAWAIRADRSAAMLGGRHPAGHVRLHGDDDRAHRLRRAAARYLVTFIVYHPCTIRMGFSGFRRALPAPNPHDEFGRLAAVFNGALGRLHNSFEQLRRFTSDASHELRTPLTAIRSVGEVALQNKLDAAGYRDVVGSMLEEVDRLSRLVDSLLALTRAESGRVNLKKEKVDLGALAKSVGDYLRVLSEEKEQTLSIDGKDAVVRGDADILRQAVINLLDNAIKYTPEKGSINVLTRRTDREAILEVSDTGPGIAETHREKIFERFYRIDEGRDRDSGGVGLGLALTRWAVNVNGGRIELESGKTQGSLFRIVLPLDGKENEAPTA
jgi:signal transduction histidine kinase